MIEKETTKETLLGGGHVLACATFITNAHHLRLDRYFVFKAPKASFDR